MLATQQNSKVLDGSLVANCVVVLKHYICNTVQGKKCGTLTISLSLALACSCLLLLLLLPPTPPPTTTTTTTTN